MKTRVKVTLRAECEVEIEVEHEPDESPTHLTDEEERRARILAPSWPEWEVERVEKA